jgi:hypothetical protein
MSKTRKDWLLAFLLTLPMLFFYARHYINHVDSISATGFIDYDNVSYVAYAKEYLDQDDFHLMYSNPLDDSASHPKIYFQTQNIFLVLLLATGMSPGFVIVLFNWLGCLLSFRIAIAIYDHLVPEKNHRKLFLTFFCWGGGLLALAGIPIALSKSMGNLDFFDRIFYLDPGWGWWGLNFGRGHFASMEGYYHFLFLSGILCILKKRWLTAIAVALVFSLSHPFSGIEFLAIVGAWAAAEKIIFRSKTVPWKFVIGIGLIFCFHLFYYLYYLNQFPEHRSVNDQYTLNWRLRYFHMIPAWCIVGTLALLSLLKYRRDLFINQNTRLFLCWFLISLVLANHEMFMRPMQPVHFTRGYIWTSLFLLGIPALQVLFQGTKSTLRKSLLAIFTVFLLSDNFLWILNYVRTTARSTSVSHISTEQESIIDILKRNSTNRTLIIGSDPVLPYLSTVYTKAYPWISHPFTTPFAGRKTEAYNRFIQENEVDTAWAHREVIFIFRKAVPQEFARAQSMPFPVEELANTSSYIVQKARIPPKN